MTSGALESEKGGIVHCKHCGEPIERGRLSGFSLVCPLCGKPQNGRMHSDA